MMKINLFCVGNLKDKEFVLMCNEYTKRISRFAKIEVVEIKEQTQLENEELIINAECLELEKKLNMGQTILFDVGSKQLSSVDFADRIEKHFLTNDKLNFVIGGSYGFNEKLKDMCKDKISFSKMTFPHRLFRVMALEQIYRAMCILNNVSYHK